MPTKNGVPTRILTRPRRSPPPPSSALFGTLADQGRLRTIDYTAVTPNPNQPRKLFDQDALERLAESIRARGLLQPLIVRETEPGSFQIIAGERRWRALGIIEAETVDVLVSESQDDATALQDALIENVVREDLTPIEKGRGYASLIEDLGLTREELARRLGESRVTISHHLRLLDLPDDTQELINARELSYAHGRVLLMTDDHTERRRLAREAVANDWSTRQLETAVRALATPRARNPKRRRDADQAALALRLGDAVSSATGLEVTVKPGARQSFAFTVVGADAARALAGRLGAHPTEPDSSVTT
jgi:ParB family transcriptional regulator, chromosome partitioning protein